MIIVSHRADANSEKRFARLGSAVASIYFVSLRFGPILDEYFDYWGYPAQGR